MTEQKRNVNNYQFENRFRVTFLSTREDIRRLSDTCVTLNLPSIIMGITPQPTSIKQIFIPGDSIDFEEVNMQFLVQENMENWLAIVDWIYRMKNPNEIDMERDVIDIGIDVLNAKHKPIIQTTLVDAFPCTVSDVPLNYQLDDVEPNRIDVTFKLNNFKYERVSNF
jgi:hypothetical protein